MFLSGLVGYLITGSITADLDWKLPSGLTIKVSSAGAFAFAIVGLVIFLHFSPVQSASQAVEQIQSSLSDKAKTSLQTQPDSPALRANIQPATKDLAAKVAAADPQKYGFLSKLGNQSISARQLGETINLLQNNPQEPNTRGLESDFGKGLPPFTLGDSLANTEAKAGAPAFSGEALPRAGEYRSADVRYFWLYLKDFRNADGGKELLGNLPGVEGCLQGGSYITFLFSADSLMRISVRLTPDCPTRQEMFRQLAQRYNLPLDINGAVLFQRRLSEDTIAAYSSSDDVLLLDVFANGSPTQ